ncbi:MAG: amidinotransferase [Desulfobacteraceae bacterium]|nr:MAG: amidinotransferase [Desulfobacteraceae bacterium]
MKYGCQSMVDTLNTVLIKHPKDAFISQAHLDENFERFNYFSAPDFENTLREFSVFESILKQKGIDIHYLPRSRQVGIDSIYTHDSVKVTRHGAIYFPMGKAARNNESTASQSFLESLGIPTLGHIRAPGKMEGGDIVWLDDETAAIAIGYRTNPEGIDQFKQLTRSFVKEIIPVPLPHAEGPSACLHLMSLISMVDHDLAVVYLKYMPVFFKEILESRGITLIDTSDLEYDQLASNVLAIGPRECIMLEGNPETLSRLEKAGANVHLYPGRDLSLKGTGGPTCLTQPILRTPVEGR